MHRCWLVGQLAGSVCTACRHLAQVMIGKGYLLMSWVAWADFLFVDKKYHFSSVQLRLHSIQLSKNTILVTIFGVIASPFAPVLPTRI